jgi:hypothetical protein
MKSAPNLLTNKYCLCKFARRRRGATYFDLATELRERIENPIKNRHYKFYTIYHLATLAARSLGKQRILSSYSRPKQTRKGRASCPIN